MSRHFLSALSRLALRSRRGRLGVLLTGAVVCGVAVGAPASGSPSLTVVPITWDVIGLDSNRPTDGPDTFPVGARICNEGSSTAADVVATLVWDSSNPYIELDGPATLANGSIAAGACSDAYFNVVVDRTSDAYDTTRAYHVAVSSSEGATISTPTPRQLYVEKLVSQNRNKIAEISGPGGLGDPPEATVVVGQTYTYQLHGSTATNGYEQLEVFVDFPSVIFQVLSVAAEYTAPTGATHDRVYADACGWESVPSDPDYRSCVGPEAFGGKAGGDIVLTYEVKILSPGAATVGGLIYDFSGSSYHYNSDAGVTTISITAVPPPTTTTTTVPPTTTTTVPPTTTTTVPPTTTSTTTTTVSPTTTTTVPPTTTTTVPPTTTTVPPTTTTVPPTTTTTSTTVPPITTTTVPPTTTTTSTTTTTVPRPVVASIQFDVGAGTSTTTVPPVDVLVRQPHDVDASTESTSLPTTPIGRGETIETATPDEASTTPTLPSTGPTVSPLAVSLIGLLALIAGTAARRIASFGGRSS